MGNLSEKELQELAGQLSHPNGENGIHTAYSMNVANDNMIRHAIDQVETKAHSKILEIGPGNGIHIKYLFEKEANLNYYGIDVSELMVEEAQKLNSEFTTSKKAVFELTDGEKISHPDSFFNNIFTANTIYFWKNPEEYLTEIFRVLQPEGTFILAFIPKEVMEKIPFSKYGFELYDTEKAKSLLEATGFRIETIVSEQEEVLSNTGEVKIRTFTIIKALKP
ncbi:class I SAM-dependent methyltransferase [Nostocaceae cyanobacterium CENA369]|uniref:Class I SAM-dependent methyltransferase n=1 Tax=Dendronalium phyllosphericum CENA369 TaxID=1725256 RepID=A0A8J7I4I0_9NOST|nr:class I SAM-dependent methyltransferase [Dendronalium phyllosphericum CENA369]